MTQLWTFGLCYFFQKKQGLRCSMFFLFSFFTNGEHMCFLFSFKVSKLENCIPKGELQKYFSRIWTKEKKLWCHFFLITIVIWEDFFVRTWIIPFFVFHSFNSSNSKNEKQKATENKSNVGWDFFSFP